MRRGGSDVGGEVAKGPSAHLGQRSLAALERSVEEDGHVVGRGQPVRGVVAKRAGPWRLARVERDEGHNVDDAKARMHALVTGQVELREGNVNQIAHVGHELVGVVDQREDAAVMERVGVAVAQRLSRRVTQRVKDVEAPSLGEVEDAFEHLAGI